MAMFAERVAVVMAIFIVGWPLTIPAAIVMMRRRAKKEKG